MKKLVVVMGLVAACGDDGKAKPQDAAPADTTAIDTPTENRLDCDVAIVGGGAGGLHTAFRLAPTLQSKVCLFEKQPELGGRIYDVPKDPGDANSPVFGAGAMRVMEGQDVLFSLATELGITFETPALEADYLNARGGWAFSKEDLVGKYGVTPDTDGDTETKLYYDLGLQAARATIGDYADFRSYITSKVGGEGFAFLHDMSRFRADFEYPLDARSYMDYLDEEWDVCCTPSYPIGGMSTYIKGMATRARDAGAQLFTNEPVSKIEREGSAYRLTTSGHVVHAGKVVIAVPPSGLDHITGDVAEEIRAQRTYKDIIAVKVVTISQWWPDRWWGDLANPSGTAPDNNLWRAWSTEHCFNLIEMPLQQYAIDQRVTRSVYDDDRNCVDYWESLYNAGGEAAVTAEIKRGLTYMFNSQNLPGGAPVTIPNPIRTHFQIWQDGWHWLRAGAVATNAQLVDWAVEPLPGEAVALVGEAYNVNRSGWSDAAYKSSIKLLNEKYGFSLPGLQRSRPAPAKYAKRRWDLRRN